MVRWSKLAGLLLVIGLPRYALRGARVAAVAAGRALRFLLRPLTGGFARGFPLVVAGYDRALGWALGRKLAVGVTTLAFATGAVLLWPRLGPNWCRRWRRAS